MNLIFIGGLVVVGLIASVMIVAITLRRVVPTNMVHIVQSRKRTTSYGKNRESGNVYYEWPSWIPGFGVSVTQFPESVFDVTLKDYEAYDSGRLPFRVDVMAFFRVADSDVAAHRVSNFGELLTQLHGVLQGAVRRVLSINALEEIMQDRSKLGDLFTGEVNTQLKEWGVTTVKNIEFMDIRDSQGSQVIQNIMAKEKSRIEKESRVAVAGNMQDAANREIDAQREVDLNKQTALEQVGQRTAEQEKAVGIAQQQSQQEVLTQTQETATREMAVKQVQDTRTAEIARQVAEITADQNRKVTVVNADAEKQRLVTVADGTLAEAQRAAEAIRVKGEAEGAAKTAILQAEVSPQITLAKEIGENEGYQSYLQAIEQIKAGRDVGIEQARALTSADVRVIATGGDISGGINSVGDLFGAKGGARLAALLAGLAQTEEGASIIEKVTADKA